MSDEQSPVRKALAEALADGDVAAIFLHRGAGVPAEVAEAVVEKGLPVHLAGEENV